MSSQKIKTLQEAINTKLHRPGKWVFTNGCFDLLHKGHVAYLAEAKALGDFLIVGINSDASVRDLKGADRPIKDQDQRSYILAGLEAVDVVVIFDEATPAKLIKALCPDILVKGGDYNPDQIVGAEFVLNNGGQVLALSYLEDYSSSQFIDKIKGKCQ